MRQTPLILLLCLAGCATYHAQPISPATLAHQFELRTLSDEGLREFMRRELGRDVPPSSQASWNLPMLTLAAWYFSPELRVARAQWATAKSGIDVADALPNPVLQLPFQRSSPNPGPGTAYTWGLALDIPIETAGKRGYRVEQAAHLAQSARLSVMNTAWKVQARVRDTLLAIYAAREKATLLSRKADVLREIVAMVEKRRAVGENAGPDVDAAIVAATQAQAELATVRGAEQGARAQLASAIGVPTRSLDAVQLELQMFGMVPAAPPDADVRQAAILNRPDLRMSLADYAAAESALQLEVAKQYPDIHLGPGYTYDTGTHKIAFGLAGINLPIFNQNQGSIAQAEANRKEAAARTAALQDTILGEIDRALDLYQANVETLRIEDARLAAARRRLDSTAAAFAAGDAGRLTYAQASADFQTNQLVRLDAAISAQQAAGRLEDAVQRPLTGDAPALKPSVTEKELRK
ncbi:MULTISPECIES: TolC family protein [Pandoraea]|uniref:Cobalt-zinc-cadmium resistance protein CzcC n=4 Tax=Pandoraea TaxID=93217 RepID=A0A5E4YEZ6_9BURK|nr:MULTISPECIES: TolC family protein [Pandoraea]MBN9094638.1 TolC family protein [Pandoraea pnomenusa]VVE45387.1 Cobalt-zinc-cadmium resistance protein CzcC [Pandoraea cepalis]VVE47291.1 Cobalt-zinc-cadmium resistance protein CzcC [Pandoraea eparura]VVG73582.1 Cobalt-zinc-cadmium resistance protein CzcC [Pandoraea apista]